MKPRGVGGPAAGSGGTPVAAGSGTVEPLQRPRVCLIEARCLSFSLRGGGLSRRLRMSGARFATREELAGCEWDNQRKDWKRPKVDRDVLKKLSERSTRNGILRVAWFVLLLTASAIAAVYVGTINPWLAIPVLYLYYFFYGFWVAIAHELQHKTVFAESADWFSEILFFFVQVIIWNSPTYARISHRLHHRYTMVRNVDPETDWPEVITSRVAAEVPWLARPEGPRRGRSRRAGQIGDPADRTRRGKERPHDARPLLREGRRRHQESIRVASSASAPS